MNKILLLAIILFFLLALSFGIAITFKENYYTEEDLNNAKINIIGSAK